MAIVRRNWRIAVRQQIYGTGNVGNPMDIIFVTAQQMVEAERKIKRLETTKQNKLKNL